MQSISIADYLFQHTAARRRLALNGLVYSFRACFNTQPPEGGCPEEMTIEGELRPVSTHSRLKAAAIRLLPLSVSAIVSTHSRLKAAAGFHHADFRVMRVSTHSRLKAAATVSGFHMFGFDCFNTQPPEGGWPKGTEVLDALGVSTHSRLKAAGHQPTFPSVAHSFNTQPPEGG